MGTRTKQAVLTADSTIGIVNRGEPALRFIRAAREYNAIHGTNLRTVAFYLDEEADALFVREADLAIAFHTIRGASQAGSIYLQRQVLIDALTRSGCDAVWPGWGFLSEDAEFAGMIESAGLVFLGPSAKAMGLLGDKIEAKALADGAGVPILPWSRRSVRDAEDAAEVARDIGYPVIVKAAHAGGGRGIRFVTDPSNLEAQFLSARDETVRVTGGDVVFIERLVTRGRHLEVQCLCDRHGKVFTFGVRDCSVQRRNQKIIEETPPPGIPADELRAIESAAASLMDAAGYESAGTVEFLYDLERTEFYFMEVNTRLQVEHPITEILYDVDLVKGQIDVAFGKKLDLHDRAPRGWVMEARLNAEDPDRDFAPSPGVCSRFRVPLGPGVRVDSGIAQGSVIPSVFDSMVAKIIASGSTREEAAGRLRRALLETRVAIAGGTTNKAFLLELLSQPEISAGAVDTKYVERLLEGGQRSVRKEPEAALVAGAIDSYLRHENAELQAFRQQISNLGYPRLKGDAADHEVAFGLEGQSYRFVVRRVSPAVYRVSIDGSELTVTHVNHDDESRLEIGGRSHSIQTVQRGDVLQCEVDGIPYALDLESGGAVKAPSPAIVLTCHVAEGQAVEAGQRLVSLEAMKMEMIIESPSAGTIAAVAVRPGQQVTTGDVLVELEATADTGTTGPAGQPEPQAARLVFPADSDDPVVGWDRLAESFGAMFFGYDRPEDPVELLDVLVRRAEDPVLAGRLFDLIFRVLDAVVSIDSLFSAERIQAESFARPVSWQELIFIYFQYSLTESDTLPQQFTAALQHAMRYYPSAGTESGAWSAFYHMYRAQRGRERKNAVLRSLLFALEGLPVPKGRSDALVRLLDEFIRLQRVESSVTDAALHARYELHERVSLLKLRNRRRDRLQAKLRDLTSADISDRSREQIMQSIVDASPYAAYELLHAYHGGSDQQRSIIVELVARRAVRDRNLESCAQMRYDGNPACGVVADGISTIVALCSYPEDARPESVRAMVESADFSGEPAEVLLLVSGEADSDSVLSAFQNQPLPVTWLSVGVYRDARSFTYRTFCYRNEEWQEDRARREFSPLFYRELRLARLSEFSTEVIYHSDSVYLVQATAKQNPRDQRLIALGSASESIPELDESGRIGRVDEFDEVFTEAVHKMRSQQSRRHRRLLWNRIVMHVRALSPTTAEQIKEYGNRIIPKTNDLGLEKAIIYTRRKRWSESVVRELELLFLNISEDQFTLRSRKPSREPLQPMDNYVSSVVRSRQRGNVYPYELIKLITYTGYPVSVNVPRGDFEEYDVEASEGGDSVAVSVKGRPYGENTSNIVFGIVRNTDPHVDWGYRRVLILSDAAGDMGSLAEPECRRIIAALDLAEKLGVPVEWVPISSGARIDMDTGTENLDWTAAVLRRIIEFTQRGGEINIIVSGINVGAQSYWNAESTMLMHTRGLLIMTDDASMLLTGKKALDFSGSVSGDTNTEIGGVEKIMGPNGQAQIRVATLTEAYMVLFRHYRYTYVQPGERYPRRLPTEDASDRDIGGEAYEDRLGQGFRSVSDLFSAEHNPERKKPFDMRQVMRAVIDREVGFLERWATMKDAETAVTWETRIGGYGAGLVGIESRPLVRLGDVPHDGPESWSGGTLFPSSSKKVARAINSWSGHLPVVVLANLSGFDGSPESLRRLQLEYGAEIGRAVVNFRGPIIFVVTARYHGGAYVVFSRALNESLRAYALEGSFASVLGGAPAAAVVFPREVEKACRSDDRVREASRRLASDPGYSQREFDDVYRTVYAEEQTRLGMKFDRIHDIRRAKSVGSIHDIISVKDLRATIIRAIEAGIAAG